jgi:hypothetical protein
MLSTPSSKQRFDFSGRKELYTSYIPWAVAFDCADEWAAKYRIEVGEEPPVPHYFAGAYAGANTGAFVSSMVGDFSSTVDSAISSYNATQSSSSPIVVLVHGAFADAASWAGVVAELESADVAAIAPPNLLRGIGPDAAYLTSFVEQRPPRFEGR